MRGSTASGLCTPSSSGAAVCISHIPCLFCFCILFGVFKCRKSKALKNKTMNGTERGLAQETDPWTSLDPAGPCGIVGLISWGSQTLIMRVQGQNPRGEVQNPRREVPRSLWVRNYMCDVYLLWVETLSFGRKVNSLNDDITTIIGLSRVRALLGDCPQES